MTPYRPFRFLVSPIAAIRVLIGVLAMLALPVLDLASARAQGVSNSPNNSPNATQSYSETFNGLSNGHYGRDVENTLSALTGQPLFNGQWSVVDGDPRIAGNNANRYLRLDEDDTFSFVMALLAPADVTFSLDVRTPDRDKDSRYILRTSGPDSSLSSGVINVPGLRSNLPSRRDSYQFDDLQAGTYTFSIEVLDDQLRLDNARFDALALSTVTAVPEPQGWAMLFAGLGAIGFLSRRRVSTAPADLA